MITRTGPITLPNNAALARGIRVKLASGYIAAAGADDDCIGTTESRTLSTETTASVVPYMPPRIGVAAGAITAHALVYRAASGKLSATSDGTAMGFALTAASGDGSEFEWLPLPSVRADS